MILPCVLFKVLWEFLALTKIQSSQSEDSLPQGTSLISTLFEGLLEIDIFLCLLSHGKLSFNRI